jgi:hypothetical protein
VPIKRHHGAALTYLPGMLNHRRDHSDVPTVKTVVSPDCDHRSITLEHGIT